KRKEKNFSRKPLKKWRHSNRPAASILPGEHRRSNIFYLLNKKEKRNKGLPNDQAFKSIIMTNENLSPEQSLQVIQSMIEKAKNQFSENGHLYLLWGWVIFIASAGQFILLNLVHYQNHSIVWFLPWLAVIYQAFYLAKRKK